MGTEEILEILTQAATMMLEFVAGFFVGKVIQKNIDYMHFNEIMTRGNKNEIY